jgi:hypothetical protein
MDKEKAFSVKTFTIQNRTWVKCYHCENCFEYKEQKRSGNPLNQLYLFWQDKVSPYQNNSTSMGILIIIYFTI